MTEIYEFITQHGKLTEAHRTDLKSKRGFTDETIDTNRFFSGGNYFLQQEAEILKRFDEQDLLLSGVCVKNGQKTGITPLLLDDRIIIPYLKKDGQAFFVRPHKLGLKNVPIEVYQDMNFAKEIIMTEGEFKATAACQMGLPCIAIPGVGSFSGKHFDRLVKKLNENGVKTICIIFDNEVKDDPRFPDKFKDSPMDRYDTQFYAFYMGQRLDKEGFHVTIGTLPDGWRQNGKIDIDGALAAGKTGDDLQRVVRAAYLYRDYYKEQTKDIQKVLNKKMKKQYFRSHVRKEFGRYVCSRSINKDVTVDIPISNFTIRIVATYDTHDGIVRDVEFINEFGEVSRPFSITAECMPRSDSFSRFCLSKGPFIWRGRADELFDIWEREFLNDDGRKITELDHVGDIEGEKIFIFSNLAIDYKGKEYRPDKNRIFWKGTKGLRPISLSCFSTDDKDADGVPSLHTDEIDLKEVRTKMAGSIGWEESGICMGWCAAALFMREVFAYHKCFPFLFLSGKAGSGKSHVAKWLIRLFGIEDEGKQASNTSPVALNRYMSYYSGLPVFLDEYRNERNVQNKDGMLRNAYNKQSAGKGVKTAVKVREERVRGTLIITGQEEPQDFALQTRCITVGISRNRRTEDPYEWFQNHIHELSYFTYHILKNKAQLAGPFMQSMKDAQSYFAAQGVNPRQAINYSIVAAGYQAVFGGDDFDFGEFMIREVKRVEAEQETESEAEVFLSDVAALHQRQQLRGKLWKIEGDTVYIQFNALHQAWAEHYKKAHDGVAFKAKTIRNQLKDYPGWIDLKHAVRVEGVQRKAIAFDLNQAPDSIMDLIRDAVTSSKMQPSHQASHSSYSE